MKPTQVDLDIDPSLQALIAVLADGQIHSGQELGEILGISRAAVWKHLQKLEALGVALTSIKGKGYCLEGGLNLLCASRIKGALDPAALKLLSGLQILPIVDSTNAHAMRTDMERNSGFACLAEFQSAGRGRRGRPWVSPYGKNIYLSLVWFFDGGAAELEGLSLAVGIAITDSLSALGVTCVELKWPNDVLWHGRKLAGILLEMSGDPAGVCRVVVGVGLNVFMPAVVAKAIEQPWADLQLIGKQLNLPPASMERNLLVARLLSHLLPLLHNFKKDRFAAYQDRWESLNAYAGKNVQINMANKVVIGKMLGVSASGALRLQTLAGEELFYGGEVTLRLNP